MTARALVLVLALLGLAGWAWSARERTRPDGVLAPHDPLQESVGADVPTWQLGDYSVRALARFELEARVLGAERYRLDRQAELAPVDLALGWGPMSANELLDTLDLWQDARRFHWWADRMVVPAGEITRHAANMHMVPLDSDVRATLLRARRGDLLRLRGWLIEAQAPDGFRWKSSLTRNDSGDGACELVAVESIALE